jgi:proline racemase
MQVSNLITAVDAHACGEPGRVIIGGVLDVPGKTMFDKKVYLETQADDLRKRMLREPRGYPALPMSGSNTICVATVLLETGIVTAKEPVTEFTLESPAGLIPVRAEVSHGKVTRVTFENVPAFAVHLDATIDVPNLGQVTVDVAYGGMFYVIADADKLGLRLAPEEGREIARVGEMIKAAAREQLPAIHPANPAISGVTISQLSGAPLDRSDRPLAMRYRNLRANGGVVCQRPTGPGGRLSS